MTSKLTAFFRSMLGSRDADAAAHRDEPGEAAVGEPIEYKGYSIRPTPQRNGSQWTTEGVITKQFPEGAKEHRFIRADTYGERDNAAECAVTKAKLIIDEQGDRMFASRQPG